MRALVFKRYGGPDQVAFADVPRPVPKPDEILVQVHAAGLNPIDNKIRDGKMKAIMTDENDSDEILTQGK
jgi:NADPH:quinone reductase-like Zn-dependent oxidoreductase